MGRKRRWFEEAGREIFVDLRVVNGSVQLEGTAKASLGHQLPRPGEDPDGVFLSWDWDGKKLRARNDRHGLMSAYYHETADRVCISPSLGSLLLRGVPAEIDHQALAIFLRLGTFLGDDTPFRGIRALPAGAVLEWEPGRFRIAGGPVLADPEPIDREEALGRYASLFSQSIERRVPEGPWAVPLSGGRGSRHILFELLRIGRKPDFCLTVDFRCTNDADVASEITRLHGLRHEVIRDPTLSVADELRANALTNFGNLETAWCLPMADRLKATVSAMYDGIGGDVLSAGLFLTPERVALARTGRFPDLADDLMQASGYSEPALAGLLTRDWYHLMPRDAAKERVASALAAHARAANPIGSFLFWNRTRRQIALSTYALCRSIPQLFAPYVDHDLVRFLASLPADLVVDHEFHSETIRRAYPKLGAIPYARKNLPERFPPTGGSRWIAETARLLGFRRESPVSLGFVAPRLLRAFVHPPYRGNIEWLARIVAFLVALEAVAQEP